MRLPWSMAGLLAFALAAVVAAASAPDAPPRGAEVRVMATVTILRAETASERPGPEGLSRHVNRRSGGQTTIEFE